MPDRLLRALKEHSQILIIVAIVAIISFLVIKHERSRIPPYLEKASAGFDFQSSMESEQGRQFVEKAIVDIANGWDPNVLMERMPQEYLDEANTESIYKVFDVFQRLGMLAELKGTQVRAVETNFTGEGDQVYSVHFVTNAEFDAGPATISTTAIHRGDKWELTNFRINSETLLDCK